MADAPNTAMLSRDSALEDKLSPTGRKFGVILEQGYALYRIDYIDGKGGALPGELTGKWTKGELATETLEQYLTRMWDMSDQEAQKLSRKNHRDRVNEKDTNGQLESPVAEA